MVNACRESPWFATSTAFPVGVLISASPVTSSGARKPLSTAGAGVKWPCPSPLSHKPLPASARGVFGRSEEHTSELQSRLHLGCRLLLGDNRTDQNLEPRVRLPTQPGQTQEPDPSAGRNPSRFRLSAAVRTSSVRDELRPDGSH